MNIDLDKLPLKKLMKEAELTVSDFGYDTDYLCGYYFIWDEYDIGFNIGFGSKTRSKPLFLEVFSASDNYLLDAIGCPFKYGEEFSKPDNLEGFNEEIEDKNDSYKIIFTDDEYTGTKVFVTIKKSCNTINHVEVYNQERVFLNNKITKKIEKIKAKMLPEEDAYVKKELMKNIWVLDEKMTYELCKYTKDTRLEVDSFSHRPVLCVTPESFVFKYDDRNYSYSEYSFIYFYITSNKNGKYKLEFIDEYYETGYEYYQFKQDLLLISSKASMKTYAVYRPATKEGLEKYFFPKDIEKILTESGDRIKEKIK